MGWQNLRMLHFICLCEHIQLLKILLNDVIKDFIWESFYLNIKDFWKKCVLIDKTGI